MYEINPRRSGRTTRIANFVVDQLFDVGECIVSDHSVFEDPSFPLDKLRHLSRVVEDIAMVQSNGEMLVNSKLVRIEGSKYSVVHFTSIFKE
jgi:hypothetical protein